MPDPRDSEQIEPTLLPGSLSVSPSEVPIDTPAHPGAHDATIKPPLPVVPNPRSISHSSLTEVDVTRAGISGVGSSAAAAVDATQVPPSSRTSVLDKTLGNASAGTPLPSPTATGTQVGRFALKGLHARGGLGEVFTARDTELNREVAVKRIQSRYADDPASRRRFLTEAEITARLDHPGVVPVFGLVADGFGRPCYAMRFIRGETLKDEIEQYHGSKREPTNAETQVDGAKQSESKSEVRGQPRSVAFRHLLQRFIAVCQAIAYAHTRKVIHRDIKPANVMVGAFGETLVVDWGLAKALDDSPDPEQLLKAASAVGFRHDAEATELPDHLTMAGTAVGTPAYMAPEQASGRIDLVGPASDVYSLGATLFAILTGKAPFSGNTTETLEKVRRGEFPAPSDENPEVPPPLDAVCRKAMSLRLDDRYATPLELAADIERWLSDEPVTCHRDPLMARLARWARRHPARVATGVSSLLAGVFAVAGIALAVNEGRRETNAALIEVRKQEQRTAEEMEKVKLEQGKTEVALSDLKIQEKKTDDQRQVAEKAQAQAEKRYKTTVKMFNKIVVDIQQRLADRAGTQEFRQELLRAAQEELHDLLKEAEADHITADRTLVAAHRQLGDVLQHLGHTSEARLEYQESVKKAVEVLLEANKRQVDSDVWEAKQDLGLSNLRLAEIQLLAGDTAAARRASENARDLFKETLNLRPNDRTAQENMAKALDQFGDILIERGETSEADRQCRAALDIRRKLANEAKTDLNAQRQLADSLDQYAEILLRSGRTATARPVAEECLERRKELFQNRREQPDAIRELAAAYSRLGEILFDRNDLTESRKAFEEARDKLENLAVYDKRNAAAQSDLAVCYGRLAAVALRCGELNAALENVTKSNEKLTEVDKADPSSTRTTRELAASYERLGDVRLAAGEIKKALAAFQKSEQLLRPIANNDPDSVLAKLALAHALERVGASQMADGDPPAAITSLTASVDLRETVLAVDRGSARAKQELAIGLGWLSDAYRAARQLIPAQEMVTREIALLRQVVDRENVQARRELALATAKWGELLMETGKPTVALITLSQSLDQFQALADADKGNAHAQADLGAAYERLAVIYTQLGQTEPAGPAMSAAHKALAIYTKLASGGAGTKAARRELAISMMQVADSHAATYEFDVARKQYVAAGKLLAQDSTDPFISPTAHSIEQKLALLKAVDAIAANPGDELVSYSDALRIPALRMATGMLLQYGNKPNLTSSVAWRFATTATTPEDCYKAACALAKCGDADYAVKALELAVDKGFRDLELLKGKEWDLCRLVPEFQKVQKRIADAKPLAPSPHPIP